MSSARCKESRSTLLAAGQGRAAARKDQLREGDWSVA